MLYRYSKKKLTNTTVDDKNEGVSLLISIKWRFSNRGHKGSELTLLLMLLMLLTLRSLSLVHFGCSVIFVATCFRFAYNETHYSITGIVYW